jgi:FG-GAP repeat
MFTNSLPGKYRANVDAAGSQLWALSVIPDRILQRGNTGKSVSTQSVKRRALVLATMLILIQPHGSAMGNTTDFVATRSAAGILPAAGSVDADTTWLAAARRHIALSEYRAGKNATGLQAPSRRQAFRTYFEPTGIRVVDRIAEGSPQLLALRLEQMGRSNSLAPVRPGEVASDGARVEIRHDSLLEWYVNSPAGLEQGFTLPERTEGEGLVVLDLSLEGAEAVGHGQSVRIATATGRQLGYGQLQAFDATGVPLPVELSVPSVHRLQLRVDDRNAVYPIVIDPLLSADADTLLESDQAGALFGFSVAAAGDVNGDGYDDVIVGAWRYDAGEKDEGAAFVFHGSAAGIVDANPASANTRILSGQAGANLGESVAGAGDVNGDGFDDVIVGAPYYDAGETDEGAAFVFLGSAAGIADATPASAHARIESDQAGANLGEHVAGAGDVNGDGFDDVIVGAPHYDAGETDEGAAFIFHGSAAGIPNGNPATAQTRFTAGQAGASLGESVAGAGDVNGDGFDDVIVGAPHYDAGETDEGAAFVFLGSASGIADATPATAHAHFKANQAGAWMGVSVAGAGDVNGDGYDDVIVGARRYDTAGKTDAGMAFVFYGSAAGMADGSPATARTRLAGDQAGAWMGHAVAGAGDVNGDGFDDVIVGAMRYDTGVSLLGRVYRLLKGTSDEGAAFLFFGSASGIADASPDSADAVFENDQPGANMGYGASGAGDVNGDGYADIIIGAFHFDCGQKDEGAAFVLLGGDAGVPGRARLTGGLPRTSCEPLYLGYPASRIAAALSVFGCLAGGVVLLLVWKRYRNKPGRPAA